jgi:hypothetical protein
MMGRIWSLIGLVLVGCLVGCGGGDSASRLIRERNKDNISRLTSLYNLYQASNQWRGPKDEATFRKFISQVNEFNLNEMGVDPNKLDQLFVSERDGQPFKIRWNVTGGMGAVVPVVFEAEGVSGKRMVGITVEGPKEVDATEYDQLWSSGAGAPASRRPEAGRPMGPPPGAVPSP